MESFPAAVVRRDLGLKRTIEINLKKELTKLAWTERDRLAISGKNPIYAMEFCPISTQPKILAVSDEIGGVSLIDTQSNAKSKVVDQHQCHQSSLYSVTWSIPYPNLLATGSSDQNVCIWDANSFQKLLTLSGHSKTVRRVRFHPTKPDIIGSGGRDGTILLWDMRAGSTTMAENEIYCAHSVSMSTGCGNNSPMPTGRRLSRQKKSITPTPVTDFLFVDDNTLISCGATDGRIKFWDIRKTYKYLAKVEPVSQLNYDMNKCNGYSSLCMDDSGNLYVSTAMGSIIRFNIFSNSTLPDKIFARPRSDYSVTIDLSRDGRYLLSGSVTPFASIWDTWDTSTNLPFAELEGTLKDYFSTPCAVFSPDNPLKIVTGADDSNLTIWRFNPDPNSGSAVYSSRTCDEIQLASFNPCVRPKHEPLLPKCAFPLTVPNSVVDLDDLPNFVLDGRLPHLPANGRKPPPKIHTWLANFSKQKRAVVRMPIKRLKRKAKTSNV